MKKNIYNKNFQILSIIFLLLSILTINNICLPLATAEETNDIMTDIAEQNVTFAKEAGLKYADPQQTALKIINTVLGFVGLIFLILIIVSGFQWMTSGGNEELINKAKKRLINATIGLGIILGAWIIANTIMLIVQGKPLKEDNLINIF